MADIHPLGNGAWRIVDGARSRIAYAARTADERWVFLDGQVYVMDVEGSPEGLPHTSSVAGSPAGSVTGSPAGSVAGSPAGSVAGSPAGSVAQPFRAARKKRRDDHTALAAPMPATVVAINAEPGQRVSQGDVLIVLEAMKMELPIKAPRDGSVRAIACRPGELVQPGVPLVELE